VLIIGILGVGRSGSTLLLRLLDGSPELWIYPIELNVLSTFVGRSIVRRAAKNVLTRLGVGRGSAEGIVEHFDAWAVRQLEELDETYVRELAEVFAVERNPLEILRQSNVTSVPQYVEAFLDALRVAYDGRTSNAHPHLMFKTVEGADAKRYCELFPDMRCVHIVRDPISNYASLKRTDMLYKQKPFWYQGGDLLRTFLERRWIPHGQFMLDARRRGDDRHFVVKYEDVCDRPAETVREICRWLNVSPPDDPVALTVLGGRNARELPASSSKKGVATPKRVARDMPSAFGYEEVVTPREREFIVFRTRDLAHELGYGLQGGIPATGRGRLLLQWLLPDEWELMNADSRLRLARAVTARRLYICGKLLR